MEVEVVIEMPARSGNKYEIDEDGVLRLDRHLMTAARCPLDYGFIEGTTGSDGERVDAIVPLREPAVPGCHLTARPVAVLWISKRGRREAKVLCVPTFDEDAWDDLASVPESARREIGQFFEIYKDIEDGAVTTEGWEGREAAERTVAAATHRG